ncbi:MAG TPA: PH domain-containing protein [Acidimicrobiales bacterium]|nr:PH domain-containing protein [Acidimicrobiales bacterium]
MARRETWRDGESRVVTVTPVSRGVARPAIIAVVLAALVEVGAHYWSWMHREAGWALLVLVGPPILVVATRTWRWRSHKIHVTSERVVTEGGVAKRYRQSVELRDVQAVRVEQGIRDRLIRRGSIYLETGAGTVAVGRVRHPAALVRLIERERSLGTSDGPPLDTVFEYEDPSARAYDVDPRWRRDAH